MSASPPGTPGSGRRTRSGERRRLAPLTCPRYNGRALPPPALRLDGVAKIFGGLRAVDGVSLTVAPGQRRALIGPNGAGKTTLFNLIAGALPVTHGRITLFGRDVTGAAAHRRAWLGLARTFQVSNLFPTLSVLENCLLAVQALTPARLAMHRPLGAYAALHERARGTLEAVGLADKAA